MSHDHTVQLEVTIGDRYIAMQCFTMTCLPKPGSRIRLDNFPGLDMELWGEVGAEGEAIHDLTQSKYGHVVIILRIECKIKGRRFGFPDEAIALSESTYSDEIPIDETSPLLMQILRSLQKNKWQILDRKDLKIMKDGGAKDNAQA